MSILSIQSTNDGSSTVRNDTFGCTYHSLHGAIMESKHVFIQNGLQFFSDQNLKRLSVLELGFGTGLNAWLSTEYSHLHDLNIAYDSIDNLPLPRQIIAQLNYQDKYQFEDSDKLFSLIHQLQWNKSEKISEHFFLQKIQIEWSEFEPFHQYDIFFMDAFGPEVQPELWSQNSIEKIYRSLHPGGIIVTYCAQGMFKRNLKANGFEVQTLSGPPGKREMTRAVKR